MFENFETRTDKGSADYCADLRVAFMNAETEIANAIYRVRHGLENFNALHTDTPISDDDDEAVADIALTDDLIADVLGKVYEFEGAATLVPLAPSGVPKRELKAAREFSLGAVQCWRVLRNFRTAFGMDTTESVTVMTEAVKLETLASDCARKLRNIQDEDALIGARIRTAVVYLESSASVLTALADLLDPLNDYLNRCDTRSEYN